MHCWICSDRVDSLLCRCAGAQGGHGNGSGSGNTMLRVVPLTGLQRDAASVKMVVCISLEEILPRPKAGLLSRMLRLADVSVVASQDGQQPVYLLHPGGEYHLGVSLFHPPSGQRVQVQGVAWVRVAVGDGQAVTMTVDRDQGQSHSRDQTAVCWFSVCISV